MQRELVRSRATLCSPNVIVICVDTLRQDVLGCYGSPRDTTPCIDALADRGMRFANAFAPSPWTWPSTASLFVGLCPREHGLIDTDSAYLAERLQTLAEVFGQRGVQTAAFSTNPLVVASAGFGQGFEVFEQNAWEAAGPTVDRAIQWLDRAHPWRFVCITSDHGEEFLEHDLIGHGKQLFDESLRVPLVLAGPGVPVGESQALVENRHPAGTLCRLADIPCGKSLRGLDLLEGPSQLDPIYFSSRRAWWVDRERGRASEAKEVFGVQDGDQRLIWLPESPWKDGERWALFSPAEGDPMTEELDDPQRVEELKQSIVDWLEVTSARRPPAIDGGARMRARLQELGYIGDDTRE